MIKIDYNPIKENWITGDGTRTVQQMCMENAYKQLINQMEFMFIQGLSQKGFEFKHKYQLEQFIKEHCSSTDNLTFKVKTYYVGNIPFLKHYYGMSTEIIHSERSITMSVDYGSYSFI